MIQDASVGDATGRRRACTPRRGRWVEMINSNSEFYGGTGLGNSGGVNSTDIETYGFSQCLTLTLPPLSTTLSKWSAE